MATIAFSFNFGVTIHHNHIIILAKMIVIINKIVYSSITPDLRYAGHLYKIVWEPVFTTALAAIYTAISAPNFPPQFTY